MSEKPFIYPRGSFGNIEPKAGDASIIADLDSAKPSVVNWSDAFLALNEADRAKAQHDYLMFGQAVIYMKDDGSAEYVPLSEMLKEPDPEEAA